MNIIIVGCGLVGMELAHALTLDPQRRFTNREPHRVSLIERRRERIDALPAEILDHASISLVDGDGASNEILTAAGAEDADVFIAVTGDDLVNGLVAQKAKHLFKIRRVLLRVRDRELASIYSDTGLDVFCPTDATRDFFLESIAESPSGS